MDVTLFEIHLPDARFNAPFAGTAAASGDARRPEEDEDRDDAANPTGPDLRPLALLVVLAGLAGLAWFLRRSGDEGPVA